MSFISILPETDKDGAVAVAGNIVGAVRRLSIPHSTSVTSDIITVSLGVVTILSTDETSPEKLVKMADDALYKAKKEGRNRVVAAG